MKKMRITAATARGNTHVLKNLPCQDARKCFYLEDGTEIIAVADGHGCMSAHPFSKDGARLAVEAFCRVSVSYIKEWGSEKKLKDFLATFGKELFANEVQMEWKKSVVRLHREKRRSRTSARDIFSLYGTTLMGIIIMDGWSFVLQIGDGDILLVSPEKAMPLIENEWIPGDETRSLCQPDVWKKAKTGIWEDSALRSAALENTDLGNTDLRNTALRNTALENTDLGNTDLRNSALKDLKSRSPYMYWISTDGFSNSFPTDEEFYQTAVAYCRYIEEYGFNKLRTCLKYYLQETSMEGCGDDITVAIGYMGE